MPTLTVEVPEHLARLVEEAVARGDYRDASAAVADALCILQYEPAAHGEKLAILRREVRKGVIQDDAGETSGRTVMDVLRDLEARDNAAA